MIESNNNLAKADALGPSMEDADIEIIATVASLSSLFTSLAIGVCGSAQGNIHRIILILELRRLCDRNIGYDPAECILCSFSTLLNA